MFLIPAATGPRYTYDTDDAGKKVKRNVPSEWKPFKPVQTSSTNCSRCAPPTEGPNSRRGQSHHPTIGRSHLFRHGVRAGLRLCVSRYVGSLASQGQRNDRGVSRVDEGTEAARRDPARATLSNFVS